MISKLTTLLTYCTFFALVFLSTQQVKAQCGNLAATLIANESRCTATGSIVVTATGGVAPERYQYKIITGPVTTAFSNSNTFAGLSPGNYVIQVRDVNANCFVTLPTVVVTGNYVAPSIFYTSTALTCINGANGTISVSNQAGGRAPFNYQLVTPSAAKIGTTSTNGTFTGLIPGLYTIRMTDSCGGIQTRNQQVNDFSWSILPSTSIVKSTCQNIDVNVLLTNTNNINSPNAAYNGFAYGITKAYGDTSWFTTPSFNYFIDNNRSATIVVKDACGYVIKSFTWVDDKPSVAATVATSNFTCNTFTATVTGQTNIAAAFTNYTLYNASNQTVVMPAQASEVFNNIPLGSYTIRINDNCYDTTLIRWVATSKPIPALSNIVQTSNKACATFTATINAQGNIFNPTYQLFDATNNTQIGANQTTGQFNDITYGDYCIRMINDPACYDTTIVRCFSEKKKIPALNANTFITNKACLTFTVTLTGMSNVSNPQYQLFDAVSNTQIGISQNTAIFNLVPYGSYFIKIINDAACYDTTISHSFTAKKPIPTATPSVVKSNNSCATFNATINLRSTSNLYNITYTLFTADNNTQVGATQTSNVFSNLSFGSYCVKIINDATCYDTAFTICFNQLKPLPTAGANVDISNKTCATFTATIIGQTNINNAAYQLYNASNTAPIGASQSSPVFNNVPNGSYCINIINDAVCYDTTITRCFTVDKTVPAINPTVTIANNKCATFTATITGQVNITNATYQLFNSANNTQIGSNQASATFNNIAYGSYCIRVLNDVTCYDTTIVACFTALAPEPTLSASIQISNKTCNTITATVNINSQQNTYNLTYKLYDATNTTQIGTTQTSPVFANIAYGQYYVRIINDITCYNITFNKTFNEVQPKPSVSENVSISNKSCATFTARIRDRQNLTNPIYKLFDAANAVQIGADQTSQIFDNVPYGSYCIRIVNDVTCYDTTIVRCFTVTGSIVGASISNITSNGTCTQIGATDINVNIVNGSVPYILKLYGPSGNLVNTATTSQLNYTFAAMPGIPAGTNYKVVIEDACANKDSTVITPTSYYVNNDIVQSTRCPSGTNPDGTGDVTISIDQNINQWAYFTINIIKKNGVNFAQSPSSTNNNGKQATFLDMAPGTYIFETINYQCWKFTYDTVKIKGYDYPNLSNSKGYICNSGLQSIGCDTKGGAYPLQYQIFQSIPSTPDINTAYQSSPIFDINNGTLYALVRLRVLDACGNASINDVGFVPVATTIIQTTNDCFYAETILSVDTVANATYTWYKRTYNPFDSTLLTVGDNYTIPFLTISDTGTYICRTSLNNGCITNIAYKNIKGNCKASVGNIVWIDNSYNNMASNGIQDAGEKGAAGVTVNLKNSMGVTVATTITDSSGYYLFSDINPGEYSIKVQQPLGYQFCIQTNMDDNENSQCDMGSDVNNTTGESYLFTLEKGENEMDIDAGIKMRLNVLPVKLQNFNATPDKGNVQLKWNVAEELNVLMYEVEHAATPNSFTKIGLVLATKLSSYTMLHKMPIIGTNYYRLKITDKDGKITYSEVKIVNFGKAGSMSVYPNPAVDVANITFAAVLKNKPATIQVFAENGQSVLVKEIAAVSAIETIDVSALPNGKYVVRIITDNEVSNLPIQVIR